MLGRRMLSKEDEASLGQDEVEVRREDQEKINRFSSLHRKDNVLEEQHKSTLKDKEDLEEVSNELELADEDEKMPYKIGDSFIWLPVSEILELLSESMQKRTDEADAIEQKLSELRSDMERLKVALYSRFGKSINLEG